MMNRDTENTARTLVADGKDSFSYGRALQDSALEAWHGRDDSLKTSQQALLHRARCNGAASLGRYTDEMEASSASPAQRHEVHDD